MSDMTAAEILKFAHYSKLGAAIALRHQTGLEPSEATAVVEISLGVHPRVGTVLIDGYLTGTFGGRTDAFVLISVEGDLLTLIDGGGIKKILFPHDHLCGLADALQALTELIPQRAQQAKAQAQAAAYS